MKNYEEMYNALLNYAKKEGLRLIEAELRNEGIFVWFYKDYIIINSFYKERTER